MAVEFRNKRSLIGMPIFSVLISSLPVSAYSGLAMFSGTVLLGDIL